MTESSAPEGHLVVCSNFTCSARAVLPEVRPGWHSIEPILGWHFDTENGWRCERCVRDE